jgi:hypothetical protein
MVSKCIYVVASTAHALLSSNTLEGDREGAFILSGVCDKDMVMKLYVSMS